MSLLVAVQAKLASVTAVTGTSTRQLQQITHSHARSKPFAKSTAACLCTASVHAQRTISDDVDTNISTCTKVFHSKQQPGYVDLQLVDKHGEVIGCITYAATTHSAVHISEHPQQNWKQQQLGELSSSSSQSEQHSLMLEESTADGMHSRHDNSQAMQTACIEQGHQLSQVTDADVGQGRLESMEPEAFIYSSTGQYFNLCCHNCTQPDSQCQVN